MSSFHAGMLNGVVIGAVVMLMVMVVINLWSHR
jgi:hypothetical protein